MVQFRTWLMLAAVATTALSGCLGNSVTISDNGGFSGTETRSIDCAGSGRVSASLSGGSTLTITVTDGDGDEIFQEGGLSGGWSGGSQKLSGTPGSWTLKVSGSHGGSFSVTLSC